MSRFGSAAAVVALLVSLSVVGGGAAHAAPGSARLGDGTVLVGFKPGLPRARRRVLLRAAGTTSRTIGAGTYVVRVRRADIATTVTRLRRDPNVRYAEPNSVVRGDELPDDAVGVLWAVRNAGQCETDARLGAYPCVAGVVGADTRAYRAWDVTTGSRDVVVAVTDTGVDYTHPDLAANMWTNPGGVNGCPAGTHGFDAVSGNADPCDPMDGGTHGTHVAGTIGAVGDNGIGVAGMNWRVSLMGVRILRTGCICGTIEDAIRGIESVVKAKEAGVNVRVISASWGCCYAGGGAFPYSQALLDEIKRAGAHDILFVASAGNHGRNVDLPQYFHYPCSYDNPAAILTPGESPASNLICVAASDQSDHLAWFSNYGVHTVNVAAPGVNIYSTLPGGGYGWKNGTSMATPQVSGAAALLLSTGYRSAAALRACLMTTVDLRVSLQGRVSSGGRLNAWRVVTGRIGRPDRAPQSNARNPCRVTPEAGG